MTTICQPVQERCIAKRPDPFRPACVGRIVELDFNFQTVARALKFLSDFSGRGSYGKSVTDDSTLLRRYVEERSDAAFTELVQRHLDLVYSVALREMHGNFAHAEDVVQEVFTALARKAPALQSRSSLAGWLHISVHHAAANVKRSEQRRQKRQQEAHAMHEQSISADAPGDWGRLEPMVNEIIGELNATDREAVLLRFYRHLRFREIGAMLRLSEDTAQRRVERALEKLRVKLGRRGITSTAAALGILLENHAVVAAPAGLGVAIAGSAIAGATAVGAGMAVAAGTVGLSMPTSEVFATGALSAVQFMTTTKLILVIVAGAGLGAALYEYAAAQHARRALAAAEQKDDQLRREVVQGATRTKALQRQLDESRVASIPPPEKKIAPSPVSAPARIADALDYYISHPEARKAYVDQQILRAKEQYGNFFKQQNLSADQQVWFLAVIGEQANAKLDIREEAVAQGMLGPFNSPTAARDGAISLERLNKQSATQTDADMQAALGPDNYQKYRQYEATLPQQTTVSEFAAQLSATDTPLNPQQFRQLTDLLTQHPFVRGQPDASPTNTMGGVQVSDQAFAGSKVQANNQNLAWAAPITDAAIAEAERVLSPSQVAALKRLQALQLTQIQLAPPHR